MGTNDFEALARQYWGLWGDAARGAASPDALPGMDGFRAAMDGWGQAMGTAAWQPMVAHLQRQHRDWYASMQQVAAQFAGREHSAAQVVDAWKQALGARGPNSVLGLFDGMEGAGLESIGQWTRAAAPWLQGLHAEAASVLGMPAFGFTREHQERLQALGQAQLGWQDALASYNRLLAQVSQDAYARFEAKLVEREEPGRQIGSVRALFDLWVDAAEDAYADTALSPAYRSAYGALVNAQMRLRGAMQAIAEQAAGTLGLPGRAELDGAHRKIAELERQLRRLQRRDAEVEEAPAPPARKPAARQRVPVSTGKPRAARAAAPAKPPARTSAVRKPAAKRKPASKSGATASGRTR